MGDLENCMRQEEAAHGAVTVEAEKKCKRNIKSSSAKKRRSNNTVEKLAKKLFDMHEGRWSMETVPRKGRDFWVDIITKRRNTDGRAYLTYRLKDGGRVLKTFPSIAKLKHYKLTPQRHTKKSVKAKTTPHTNMKRRRGKRKKPSSNNGPRDKKMKFEFSMEQERIPASGNAVISSSSSVDNQLDISRGTPEFEYSRNGNSSIESVAKNREMGKKNTYTKRDRERIMIDLRKLFQADRKSFKSLCQKHGFAVNNDGKIDINLECVSDDTAHKINESLSRVLRATSNKLWKKRYCLVMKGQLSMKEFMEEFMEDATKEAKVNSIALISIREELSQLNQNCNIRSEMTLTPWPTGFSPRDNEVRELGCCQES